MSVVNFESPPPGHNYTATVKPDETGSERFVRLFKELTLFLMAAIFSGAIVWFCYQTLDSNGSTAEEKKWAMSILSAAAGSIIGYLVRK